MDQGALLNLNSDSGLSRINEAIARNNRDTTGGGYLVQGLSVSALDETQVSVSPGSARIEGYPVEQATNRLLALDMDPDLENVDDETHILASSGIYEFHRSPVVPESVTVSLLRAKTQTLTRDYLGAASDIISEEALHSIVKVTQGKTTFTAGVDYQHAGKAIKWLATGKSPAANAHYQVHYQYRQRVKPDFTGETTLRLEKMPRGVKASEVLISYQFKKPRLDLLVLDKDGKIHQMKGLPELDVNHCQPLHYSGSGLALADCLRTWDGQLALHERKRYYPNVEQAMNQAERLAEVENMVLNLMANTRLAEHLPTGYHKYFHETFVDDKHRDGHYPDRNNALMSDGELVCNSQYLSIVDLDHPECMLPAQAVTLMKQTKISEAIKINAFKEFKPLPPEVELIPAVDRFEVNRSKTLSTRNVSRTTGRGFARRVTTSSNTKNWTEITSARFMRQRQVAFKIRHLHPDEALEAIRFSGHTLKVNAKANAEGEMSGSFTVPAQVPTGKTRVKFQFPGKSTGSSDASAVYEATGTVRTAMSQTTVTTVTEMYDPVAQTFSLKQDQFLHGASVYLQLPKGKGVRKSVVVQLRECVGDDRPGKKILGQCRLTARSLNFSNDVVQHPIKQTFTFDKPVFVEANRMYALVVLTDSADYEIGIATLGQSNGRAWMRQQAHEGVLFVSANAGTWTAKQGSDLAFELQSARFGRSPSKTFTLGSFEVEADCHYMTINSDALLFGAQDFVEAYLEQNGLLMPVPLNQSVKRPDDLKPGKAVLKVRLSGTQYSSPILAAGTQISQQQVVASSQYLCEGIATQGKTQAIVKVEVDEPSADAQVQLVKLVETSKGHFTEEVLANPTAWDKALRMEDGWLQRTYELNLPKNSTAMVRFNLRLLSNKGALPRARNFGVLFK